MKKLLIALFVLGSFSTLANECSISLKLGYGVQDSTEEIVASILETKGYTISEKLENKSLYVNTFGEEQLHNGEDFVLFRAIDGIFSTKGGYTVAHDLGAEVVKVEKGYKQRRFANTANYNIAIENLLNRTITNCN